MGKREQNQIKPTRIADQIANLKNGHADAIGPIYAHYFHKLLYYGVQVIGMEHRKEVEDTIQELFIWLVQNSPKIAQVKNFEVYLFQSLRRNLQSRLSLKKNQKATFDRYLDRTAPLRSTSAPSAEQIQITQENTDAVSETLQQEIAKLPAYQRQAIYLKYFEHKSYTEIAEILSVSQQVAYNYVFRAIKKLKEQMVNITILITLLSRSLF